MSSPAEDLATHIGSLPAFTLGTDLFIGKEPESPPACATLYDTGGGAQDSMNDVDESFVMLRVRDDSYSAGYEKARIIKLSLQSIPPLTLGDNYLVGIWMTSNIAFIGKDGNDRSIFSLNMRLVQEPTINTGHRN